MPRELELISDATLRNWKKLGTDPENRLVSRANKRCSSKRILPAEYFRDKDNIPLVQNLVAEADKDGISADTALLSLGINLLKRKGLIRKPHVTSVLREYSDIDVSGKLADCELPEDEYDILGLVYQCILKEGTKNLIGSYYTPEAVAKGITESFDLSGGRTLFDPCCGSGTFLLAVKAEDPMQLFGADNDSTAVLAAKLNLLLKYPDKCFVPQIYCLDYLKSGDEKIFGEKFDYAATNPPWGALPKETDICPEITSKESFSHFFVKAFGQLKYGGTIRFLFPEAILNVRSHRDIRRFILEKTGFAGVTLYDGGFSGVTARYVDIECIKGERRKFFTVKCRGQTRKVCIKAPCERENFAIGLTDERDERIIKTVRSRGELSLRESIWALGIVTGDNKSKVFSTPRNGMEKIYTGKEIEPYSLKPAKNYILYDKENFQQAAKDEIYRAEEKLIYKFISKKLVFAYDSSGSLFLNSANILIPKVEGMSAKTVLAFLNSSVFNFMYIKLFGGIKVLKGALCSLPFPRITAEENSELDAMAAEAITGNFSVRSSIDEYIFSMYEFCGEDKEYIMSEGD